MKTTCIFFCEKSDIEIVFDDDTGRFILRVATNRVPVEKHPDLSSTERMAQYFERLREGMTKINKGHDGLIEQHHSLAKLDQRIEQLQKAGYIVPSNYAMALDPYRHGLKPPSKKQEREEKAKNRDKTEKQKNQNKSVKRLKP